MAIVKKRDIEKIDYEESTGPLTEGKSTLNELEISNDNPLIGWSLIHPYFCSVGSIANTPSENQLIRYKKGNK